MNLVVRTQVKEILREQGIHNMSADFMDTLDEHVKEVVLKSVKRAKDNTRRTVMGRDV